MKDKNLFKGAAKYYARYRPAYPKRFILDIVTEYKLDGNGYLLDLGCGTGQLAIPLAKYFKKVYAIDPQAGMLAEGRRCADGAGVKNIVWKLGRAENLKSLVDDRKFKLVVMGRSFHWMNRKKVLADLYKIVVSGGGVVIVADGSVVKKAKLWQKVLYQVIQKHIGPSLRSISQCAHHKIRHEVLIKNSLFWKRHTYELPIKRSGQLIR